MESPSRRQRMTTDLLVVARNQPVLYTYLKEDFASEGDVQVVMDRRVGERRRDRLSWEPERRRADRRAYPDLRDKLTSIGFAVVCLENGAI